MFLGALTLMSFGLFISCGDDENDFAQNNNQVFKPIQKVVGPDWDHGRGINPDKDGYPTDCEVVQVEDDCLIIYGKRESAQVNDLKEIIDNGGNVVSFLDSHRGEFEAIFDEEFLDAVVNQDLRLTYKTNSDNSLLFFFTTQIGHLVKTTLVKH